MNKAKMKILSFGGGVQTTALAVLAAKHEVEVDAAIFADPGAEKPETYWYIENYIKPLFKEAKIPFEIIPGTQQGRNLYEHCMHYKVIPSLMKRWCTTKHKIVPIERHLPKDTVHLIGFSIEEIHRTDHFGEGYEFPLADLKLTGADCQRIISSYGWPKPVKSSCYFCVFARWTEWNWLKTHHPELIERAVYLEANYYKRRPDLRETAGLFGGAPLWKYAQGIQMEMPMLKEYSCWDGACGH